MFAVVTFKPLSVSAQRTPLKLNTILIEFPRISTPGNSLFLGAIRFYPFVNCGMVYHDIAIGGFLPVGVLKPDAAFSFGVYGVLRPPTDLGKEFCFNPFW